MHPQEIAVPMVIGPAGESRVRFAVIENYYWCSAGRTGMGLAYAVSDRGVIAI